MQSFTTKNDRAVDAGNAGWAAPLAMAAAIFCAYFFLSNCSTIWDRDEARFSRATAEMISSGNYLFPTFMGKLRPDKPILIYWLMSVPVRIFGHVEWAYRLCSVIGTTFACLFTYVIGRTLFSPRSGLWAMAFVAANPLMMYEGQVATSDAVLLAFMTGSLAVFADAVMNRWRVWHVAALSFLFAGGLLTKGPVALLPIVPFIATSIVLRRKCGSPLFAIANIAVSALIACAVFASWFYPANSATHGEFYEQAYNHHVLERMKKPLENHGGYSIFYLNYYWLVIAVAFFPWTLFLPGALRSLYRSLRPTETNSGDWIIAIWTVSFLIVMTAISTKLPHYILPVWPALALCVGDYLEKAATEKADSEPRLWKILGRFLFLSVALVAIAALAFGPEYMAFYAKKLQPAWTSYANDSRAVRAGLGAFVLFIALFLSLRHNAALFKTSARVLLVAWIVLLILTGAWLLPGIERIKISAQLAKKIREHSSEDDPVTLCGFDEASLIFYLNRKNVENIIPAIDAIVDAPRLDAQDAPKIIEQALVRWAENSGAGVLVIPRPMFEKLMATNPILAELIQVAEVRGFNYSKGQWADVLALCRRH